MKRECKNVFLSSSISRRIRYTEKGKVAPSHCGKHSRGGGARALHFSSGSNGRGIKEALTPEGRYSGECPPERVDGWDGRDS